MILLTADKGKAFYAKCWQYNMAKLISGFGKDTKAKSNKRKSQKTTATYRGESVKIFTAAGRKTSSTRWLTRHFNDPYVQKAQRLGYRSRAAFKLIEIEEKSNLLKKARIIVDLGAAPGGWLQIAQQLNPNALLIGCDILPIEPIAGTEFIEGDFTNSAIQQQIIALTNGIKPDLIISDMSPNMTGNKAADLDKMVLLLETTWQFVQNNLELGGNFIAKTRESGLESHLLKEVKARFKHISHHKPQSSRKETSEFYLIASGFRA